MSEHSALLRLGETFRQVRERQQFSVTDLAARTGIDAQHIRALEGGRLDPAYDVLIALADGLGVRASELVPKEQT
jgi:transcriptional regulator with XRE-family HTH domain